MAADPEAFRPHRPESVDLHHRVEPTESGVVLAYNRSGDEPAGGRANAAALNTQALRDRVGDLLQLVGWTPGMNADCSEAEGPYRLGGLVVARSSRVSILRVVDRFSEHGAYPHAFSDGQRKSIGIARYLCGQVGVMCRGKTVELDDAETVCTQPNQEYTQRLISVVSNADPARGVHQRTQVFDFVNRFDRFLARPLSPGLEPS